MKREVTRRQTAQMIDARMRGMSVREIADLFEITPQAVYERMKSYRRREAIRARRDRDRFRSEQAARIAEEERRKRWARLRRETETLIRTTWFMVGPGALMFDEFNRRRSA